MKIIYAPLILVAFSGLALAENTEVPVNTDTTATAHDMPAPAEGFSRGVVERAVFTTDIVEREPADEIATLDPTHNQVYFFTELRDMSGHTAVHRWEYDGEVIAEVDFNVRAPRWRVWSSKKLDPSKTGTWTVSVINTTGDVLKSTTFTYGDLASAQ